MAQRSLLSGHHARPARRHRVGLARSLDRRIRGRTRARRYSAVLRETIGMPNEALIVIDMQNDFCEGGTLALPGANAIVPLVNRLIGLLDHVVLTQDWHPPGHASFASSWNAAQPFPNAQF